MAIRNLFGSADDRSLFLMPLFFAPLEYWTQLLIPIVLFYLLLAALSNAYARWTLRSGK